MRALQVRCNEDVGQRTWVWPLLIYSSRMYPRTG